MPYFGVHESISNGFDGAVETASGNGFQCVQIFSANASRWAAKPIEPKAAAKFQEALDKTGMVKPIIHDSYLINLASVKEDLLEKSVKAFSEEIQRADALGIDQIVMHPGSAKDDTRENGLRRVAESFDRIFDALPESIARVLIETTAGQGSYLGATFEEIAAIISASKHPDRLAVCFDTCHVFVAGYDFTTPESYAKTFDDFDRIIGLDRLRAFHLNDAMKGLGSKVDRHAHIGHGEIGLDAFRMIVNDPRFAELPMYMETPKGNTPEGENWDVVNLKTLSDLVN